MSETQELSIDVAALAKFSNEEPVECLEFRLAEKVSVTCRLDDPAAVAFLRAFDGCTAVMRVIAYPVSFPTKG